MPLYEHLCKVCGIFEDSYSILADPPKVCPKGHSGVRRLISRTYFKLLGGGWPSQEAFQSKVKNIENRLEHEENEALKKGDREKWLLGT